VPAYFDGKLVFVHIPKCAGTSIKKSLKDYQLRLKPESLYYSYRMHESLFEIENWFLDKWGRERWDQSTIFSTIRHPIERIVSWWKFHKTITMMNYRVWKAAEHLPDARTLEINPLCVPYFTLQDQETYVGKVAGERCHHITDRKHVDEFCALSFEEFLNSMTEWKSTGCSYPLCPYHAPAPQARWLTNINGNIPWDRLNLFLVEDLKELQHFLPGLKEINKENSSKSVAKKYLEKEEETSYINHLTTNSLLFLRKYYSEDFKIYETLKNRPLKDIKPFRLET